LNDALKQTAGSERGKGNSFSLRQPGDFPFSKFYQIEVTESDGKNKNLSEVLMTQDTKQGEKEISFKRRR